MNLIKRIESEFSAEIISCKLFILNLIKRIESLGTTVGTQTVDKGIS